MASLSRHLVETSYRQPSQTAIVDLTDERWFITQPLVPELKKRAAQVLVELAMLASLQAFPRRILSTG